MTGGARSLIVNLLPMEALKTQKNQEKPASSARIAPRLGIIGGGQLARMTAVAALRLGCDVIVLERNDHSPAAQVATRCLVGDWNNPEALLKLASQVDVVSIENEFISTDALAVIEKAGHRLFPSTETLRLIQDKLTQKQCLQRAGLATTRFVAVENQQRLAEVTREFGLPLVLKARRNGYDGKGNYTIKTEADIPDAWKALNGDRNELYAEAFCNYHAELAVIITRGQDGAMAVYPVVETVQRDHICHIVRAPAAVSPNAHEKAHQMARAAIEAIEGVGSFGIELFVSENDEVMINELAPRVHNSGHYTIEGCVCSQFENHVRALFGWPLGSTAMVNPAAVMVNLLGASQGSGAPLGIENALQVGGAHIHIYGKAMSGRGRKMGHVTAIGPDVARAEAAAQSAAGKIFFGSTT
ncbi:MAG: 5-(carboxyamino)imidazole ribonucleotide synthase [Verrucomicrobiales bacterium]|nr:5-(carboxyamino)imidazole ribonucleotide synthase [Verrucomicrobiales bacterium]